MTQKCSLTAAAPSPQSHHLNLGLRRVRVWGCSSLCLASCEELTSDLRSSSTEIGVPHLRDTEGRPRAATKGKKWNSQRSHWSMAVLKWNGRCWMVLIRSQAWNNSPWLCALPSRLWFHPQSDPQKACASQLISFLSLLPVNRILGPQRFPFVLFPPLSVQAGYVCLSVFFLKTFWVFGEFLLDSFSLV